MSEKKRNQKPRKTKTHRTKSKTPKRRSLRKKITKHYKMGGFGHGKDL